MEEFKKGNLVFWKRPVTMDLFCIVQEVKGDQVLLRYMHGPPSEFFSVNKGEIVKLAEEQERLVPSDFEAALKRQREIHFPPRRGRKKKKEKERMKKARDVEDEIRGEKSF